MSIRNALAGLESEGITVPHADAYHAAISALSGAPAPEIAGPLLGTDPAVLVAHATDWAAWRAGRDDRLAEAHRVSVRLTDEMAAVLAGESERIVDVLAPRFAEAADTARALVAAGVRPADTLETLALRAPDAIPAWLAFQRGPLQRLTALASLRVDLARATDEHGARSTANLSHLLTRPARPVLLEPAPGRPPWWPWLTVAEQLVMLRPSEVDPGAVLTAKGYSPSKIDREAERREAATTPATPTAAAPVPLPA